MANTEMTKLVSLQNLTAYDGLIKSYIENADSVVDAKSIKNVSVVGDVIYFFKEDVIPTLEDGRVDTTKACAHVNIASSDVETLKSEVAALQAATAGYDADNTVAAAVADAKKAGTDAQAAVEALANGAVADNTAAIEANETAIGQNTAAISAINNAETGILAEAKKVVKALEDGQVKTNKEAIEAINDETTGIKAVAKKYTDDEIKKVNDKIGVVAEDTTVVEMIADAKKAGTDANSALETYKTTNDARVEAVENRTTAVEERATTLENTMGDMANVTTTAKTVAGAVDELKAAVEAAESAGEVELEVAGAPTEGYLKTYVFSQGGKELGKIDIPKDLVVSEGSVVTDPEGQPEGTYIKLVIANQDEPLYINVANLVDVYTGAEDDHTKVTVNGYEIAVTIKAGGVGTTELADAAVTTAKIADENVTKAKLASDVQASLEKADAAAGELDAAIKALDSSVSQTAGADGLALSVEIADGKLVSISGSIADGVFDEAGAADAVQKDLDNYKYDVATSSEISGLFNDEISE